MNNSLPSLLDAIFGKEDLASVSLDEMYELINEFPSFNAAHFLLSKKLKQENETAYEKETMRTALYFNNVFWLQSVLDEENNFVREPVNRNYRQENGEDGEDRETYPVNNLPEISEDFKPETAELPDQPEKEEENIIATVSSFDELISKYHIDKPEWTAAEKDQESNQSMATPPEPAYADESLPVDTGREDGFAVNTASFEESIPGPAIISEEEAEKQVAEPGEFFEIRKEIIDEYGIFEEVVINKHDQDLDIFDRPSEDKDQEKIQAEQEINPEKIPAEQEAPSLETAESRIQAAENENIVENPIPEKTNGKPVDHDYEAFDRPLEYRDTGENPSEPGAVKEMGTDNATPQADETEIPEGHMGVQTESVNGEMLQLSERFGEQQKFRAPFDPKKSESIVFAPYHMIDYFASQGIKLALDENPADQFGKQLKSFTDWLKVMKKLPVQPAADKTDEHEVERIRHFAAHSIEERDILTESMAEVLAKQGMYENAIALYQKLSLIYPPKSAYFASRIEQLKASLP